MNMKKTIAALAAGAVAVSAMATSVSALETNTLNYNLCKSFKAVKAGTQKLVASFSGVTVTDGTPIKIGLKIDDQYTVKGGTVVFKNTVGDAGSKTLDYTTNLNWAFAQDNLVITVGDGLDIDGGTYDITVTVNAEHFDTSWYIAPTGDTVIDIDTAYDWSTYTPDITGAVRTADYTVATEEVKKVPFKTTITDNVDVVSYLEFAKVNGENNSYKNVNAVLNDAIENYENVTFTFNTAKDYIGFGVFVADSLVETKGYEGEAVAYKNDKIVALNKELGGLNEKLAVAIAAFDAAAVDVDGDPVKWADATDADKAVAANATLVGDIDAAQAAIDDKADEIDTWTEAEIIQYYTGDSNHSDYRSFPEHTYNGFDGNDWFKGEGTGNMGFDWTGVNLFGGALVVNEWYTMSLADVCYFDLAGTTISFDWDAIMADAKTTNNYATYLQTLKLCTSTTWYWDSLDVVLTAGAVEDGADETPTIDDESEVKGDGEDLETDDEADEDITADDEADEDITADDEADEDITADDEAEDDTAAAPEASNPETGNAPVALAVIPVALAAAAVVAKKRS